jgi:beta-phosphoglucomutase-like phosphatase (HAD superfamily)
MVDAVLLEWEGVLADTTAARRDAMLQALREEGVHFDPVRLAECCDGLDVTSAARAAVADTGRDDVVLAELIAMRARRAFAERVSKGLTLHPGARLFAERIAIGARTAIVTSASRSETAFLLRLAGLEATTATVLTSDDTTDSAPSAALYRKAMEQLGRVRPVRPERTIALVSTPRGIRAARAAGVHTVAVHVAAHVAVDADGVLAALMTSSLDDVARAAGIETAERHQ